jgi:prephenate dehydratase
VAGLQLLADAGVNLTKIESRPVVSRPWEYVFYVDARYFAEASIARAIAELREHCVRLKVLGQYRGA